MELTRRNFVAGTVLAGGAMAMGGAPVARAKSDPTYAGEVEIPAFLVKPEPITDIAEVLDYDVVVVGAGSAGVPAALAAFENGATVALLQKEATAISQGGASAGIDLEKSDPEGVAALVSLLMEANQFRSRRDLIQAWVDNSAEAMNWMIDKAATVCSFTKPFTQELEFNGKPVTVIRHTFSNKPYANGDAMIELCNYAKEQGVDVRYETPGVQLVQGEDGRVSGVIGQAADGSYIQFNASKGVIIATGDYQNDYDMCSYYLPDLENFERKQFNKTGDGHKMIVWAGGKIEDAPHTKMLHDYDGGPGSMADMPYLAVKDNGERFVDESVEMSLFCNFLRGPQDCGWYTQIFDADYQAVGESWGMNASPVEDLENYMPELDNEKKGVYPGLVNTFRADTLEELAGKLGITDVETFLSTVERYNELCAEGSDVDFGKDAKYLAPVVNPPFYGIHRHVRISAICAGVEVDVEQRCLTPEGEVIPGLYAVGNVARFYGGVDYPLDINGLSIGRAYTQGYTVGKKLATM